jgi:hypothetical protein
MEIGPARGSRVPEGANRGVGEGRWRKGRVIMEMGPPRERRAGRSFEGGEWRWWKGEVGYLIEGRSRKGVGRIVGLHRWMKMKEWKVAMEGGEKFWCFPRKRRRVGKVAAVEGVKIEGELLRIRGGERGKRSGWCRG